MARSSRSYSAPNTSNMAGNALLMTHNPALTSQPQSANFQMHTQLPPVLASRMTGSGMYGGGLRMSGGGLRMSGGGLRM